jgi:PAS domain S-box-containing protein
MDIKTREENESLRQEIERFQARLDLALDAGRMGAWQFDVATGRVAWTATLERIHGLEVGTFGGTFEDYQRDIHPDDREYVLQTISRSLTGASPHYLTYRIVRPDGSIRWLEASGKLIESLDGRPVQMMGVCCDVTDRVAGEHQRQQLLLQAEEALRARDDLLAMVSHDLRSPLNVVSICAQIITQRIGESDPQLGRDVDRISRAVGLMAELISNLLDAASIEGGSFRVHPAETNVSALVAESVDASAPLASQRDILIETEWDDPLATIECDANRIRQVLGNLLGNAIKFSPDGTRVKVTARREGASYVFAIQDQGPGIPRENTSLVFDRYWKGKQSGRAGTGLGLYIARGIVTAHGGELSVESVVGEGSTFSFSIPVAQEPRSRNTIAS